MSKTGTTNNTTFLEHEFRPTKRGLTEYGLGVATLVTVALMLWVGNSLSDMSTRQARLETKMDYLIASYEKIDDRVRVLEKGTK